MADGRPNSIVLLALVLCLAAYSHGAQQYLGKFLGKLSELHHGVSGEVYAVDARTLHLKDFTYDGEGPAAYFWAGSSRTPGSSGFRVRDENGSGAVLKRYRKKSVTITLPDGKNLNNIKWFSVWCDEFAVNFGDVKIPRNFDYPKPQKIEPMRGVHGISSDNIVIVDAQTLLVPNLSYDGEAPDAKFWVGRGSKPSPQGIRVPDENGKEVPLRKYDRKTVVLTLPGDLTVFDIGHFGIWCEAFTVDFGHVRVPQSLNVPPSLKMLGVSPQKRARAIPLPGETSLNGLLPRSPELVGAHLEVTTYRPPSPLIQHPTLVGGQQSIQAQQLQQQQQQIQQQQLQQIQQHQVYIAQHRPVNAGVLYPQQQQQQYIQQQFPSEVNRGLANPQQQYHVVQQQQPLQYYSPQLLQQQSLINQQQQFLAQRRIDQNVYSQQQQQQQQQQHPQPNLNQQHPGYQHHVLNEQLAYNQLLNQRRLLEEQQLRERLSKSYNRFDLSSNGAPFG